MKEPKSSLKEELGPDVDRFINDIKESWGRHGWLFAVLTVVIASVVMLDVLRKRIK